MGIGPLIQGLLPNYLAALLPNNDMINIALVIWLFCAWFAGIWCWRRVRQRPSNVKMTALIAPLLLISVCLAGGLGGIYWISRLLPVPIVTPYATLSITLLKERVATLTRDLRALEDDYDGRSEKIGTDSFFSIAKRHSIEGDKFDRGAATDEFIRSNTERMRLESEKRSIYLAKYHVETNQIYLELCSRLKLEPVTFGLPNSPKTGLSGSERLDFTPILTGSLAGTKPLHRAADLLDKLSMSL